MEKIKINMKYSLPIIISTQNKDNNNKHVWYIGSDVKPILIQEEYIGHLDSYTGKQEKKLWLIYQYEKPILIEWKLEQWLESGIINEKTDVKFYRVSPQKAILCSLVDENLIKDINF